MRQLPGCVFTAATSRHTVTFTGFKALIINRFKNLFRLMVLFGR